MFRFRTALALAAIGVTACGGASPTAPADKAAAAQVPPTLTGFSAAKSPDTYLRATVSAAGADADGDLHDVIIDWGDSRTTTVTAGFDAIAKTHDYATTGSYTITATARDVAGHATVQSGTVTLDPVPHACLDVKVVDACFTANPDFKGGKLVFKVLDNQVASYELSTTKNTIEGFIPVGGVLGQIKVDITANFSPTKGKNSLTIDAYACTLFSICTSAIANPSFKW